MERFLFFQAAANDAAAYPASALRGIDTANGAIHLYFTPQRITDVAASDSVDRVILACGTDEKLAVKAVIDAAMATGSTKEPMVTIADEVAGTYIGGGITACTSITYAV
tara:strand:- start:52 stop:378 length:327 start_codon:yes stop_codon:yes gene_type:complete